MAEFGKPSGKLATVESVDGFSSAVADNSRAAVMQWVESILTFHASRGGKLPDLVPAGNKTAAAWFLDFLIEPYDKDCDKAMNTHAGGYIALYRQRVADYVRRFLDLSQQDQRYVIAAREDGCYWRGDDMAIFPNIVDETVKYKSMTDTEKAAYRKSCIAAIKSFTKRHA